MHYQITLFSLIDDSMVLSLTGVKMRPPQTGDKKKRMMENQSFNAQPGFEPGSV